ncbi:MAG: multicopper oxidase domain-containing protein, partial [Nitrospirota bacterium]
MLSRTRLQLFVGGLAVFASALVAGSAEAVTYSLRATTGSVTMPDGTPVEIRGFADCGSDPLCASNPPATLPGPTLVVPAGDSLVINLKNDLDEAVSVLVPGMTVQAVPTPGTGPTGAGTFTAAMVAAGGSGSFTFTPPGPGTYLYESGTNQAEQVQMGLYGAVVVQGYPAGTFDREQVVVLSDIDPAWHAEVAAGNPYNPIYFAPKYWLINGKAYPDTQDVLVKTGEKLLLRYVNAGSQDHVIVIKGLAQRGIADDANLTTYPQDAFTVVMAPGQTRDVIVTAAVPGDYPLFDRRLDITNADQFPGGMITMVRAIDSALAGLAILSSPPAAVTLGDTLVYDVVAVDGANLDAALTYGVSGPASMAIDGNGRLTWAPAAGDASALIAGAPHSVTVSVDNGSGPVTQVFDVFVNSVPQVDPITDQTLTAGSPLSVTVIATDADTDLVQYVLVAPPPGMTIDAGTGVISWTPTESLVGDPITIQVQADDNRGGVGSQAFAVTVASALPPPAGGGGGG